MQNIHGRKKKWTDRDSGHKIHYIKSRKSPLCIKSRAQRGRKFCHITVWQNFLTHFGRRALTSVLFGKHSQPNVSIGALTVISMTLTAVALQLVFPKLFYSSTSQPQWLLGPFNGMISPKNAHPPSIIIYTILRNNMMDTNTQSKMQTKRKSMSQYEKKAHLDLRQKALK